MKNRLGGLKGNIFFFEKAGLAGGHRAVQGTNRCHEMSHWEYYNLADYLVFSINRFTYMF